MSWRDYLMGELIHTNFWHNFILNHLLCRYH